MSNCVIKNAEFFNTAKRLRIPANNLEVIVHEYVNNISKEFPTDAYIKSKFFKKPFITSDMRIIDRWREFFSSPINLSNMSDSDRRQTIQSVISTFGSDNIIIYTNDDNIEVLVVSMPLFKKANINNDVPEGFVPSTLYDKESYEGDLKFYNTYRKSFTFKKDADALRDKVQNEYPNRIRVVPDRNNKGQWIVDIKKPTTSDDKFKLYVPSEEIYEDDIYDIDDWADFLSEDDILSNSALEEQDRREQELDEKEDMLFQKKKLLQELDKLKLINHPLRRLGSSKKIKEALKNTGVSPLIYNTIIKAIELDSSLLDLKPYDLFQVISKQQTSDLADLYNQYLQKPINKELEKHLTEFLERYHVDINVGNAVQKFGVAGAYDIINKIIYLANESDRNAITFTEEFAHAFVELMGAKVSRKPENANFTFLFTNVENTKIYRQVYEEYKDTYLTKEGKPDIYKIKKEAIGQALATAINYKWEHRDVNKKEESGFWAKLKQWFENILKAFTGAEYLNFDSLINTIAEDIINNNHDRLQKVDSSNYSLLNYSETIANQNKKDNGIAVSFMQYFSELGNIITGSLAYRLQGTVYRASLDALHDIDMIVPMEIHNIPFESALFKNAIKNNKFGNNVLLDYIKTTEYFKNILEKFPKMKLIASYNDQNTITINAIYCEDESISEQFINTSGSFASRLDKFTEEQRNQIYLFDFFLKSEDVPYIEDKENNFKLALYSESFRGKLFMSRAKDIYDYQNYKLFEEFKGLYTPSTEGMMFQKPQNGFIWNAEQSATIKEVSDFINRRLRGEEKQPFYTIQGKAGTGKTTIINEILRNIKSPSRYTQPVVGIGALSHKAKEVLTDKISDDNLYNFKVISKSIAGLLGAKSEIIVDLKTGEAVEKIIVDKDDFTRNSVFKKASVVFVDEASMVNEYILELIKEDTEGSNVAVIFIGDIGQLPPIRSEADPYYKGKAIQQDKLSPVFEDATIPKSKLNIRVRQGEDSPVLAYADYYWDFSTEKSNRYPIDTYLDVESNITDNGALIIQGSDTDLTKQLLPLFERSKNEKNPNIAKIVAYTNAKVNDYNRRLHFALHPEAAKNNDMNYQEGDLIMFLDNYQKSTKETIENASEGIVEKVIREYEYNVEGGVPIKVRELRLKLNNGKFHIVPVLENSEENIETYNKNLEDLKNEALKYKKGSIEAKYAWQNYFKYKNLCAKIGFGYAITSHKSQGSTYEVVAVDSENIEGVKPISYKSKARSIYTALTRASNVTIVNSSTSKALPPSESISDINDRIIKNKKKGSTVVTPSVEEVKKENANPPTSSRPADITEPINKVAEINLGGEQLNIEYTYVPNEATDRLASSNSKGNITLYKLRGNNEKEKLEFFFDYIFGKSEKTYSKQKTQIFKDLTNLGYTEQFIRSLITTPKEAFTFLLLHENQHIINKDHSAAQNATEQEIYNIEYRATYNALRQLIDSKGVSNPEDSLKKNNAYKILNEIATFNREHLTFDEKTHIYYIDGVPVDTTVTKVLHGEINEDSEYLKISSTLGNVHDNIARDYLSSKNPIIKYVYPNMTEQDVKDFHTQLDKVKDSLDSRFGKGKYEIITDENLLRLVGRINIDGQTKTIAGTMDMLVIDSQGNFHIFDFKTNRANNHIEFTAENSLIYPAQVSMYGQMLSQNYGAKIGSHNLIQLNLKYATPKGKGKYETGDVIYNIEQGQDQIFAIYDNIVAPIQNAYRKGALGSVRIYEPGKLYKIHENVEADPSVLKGRILPYKEVIPERLKDTLENKVKEASKETQSSETKSILSSYEFYSGAAKGADTVWEEKSKALGIKTKNYTEESWNSLSKEEQDKLSKEYEEVARYIARPIIASGAKGGKLVRRDMIQADKADAIFAISTIIKPGEKDKKGYINRSNHEVVEGGTAYAATRGILRGIPVYVFDQSDNQWKVWNVDANSFITISEPTLTPHAATIGTREINDSGRQAIKSVLNNSINKINNVSSKEYSDTTYEQIMELFNKNPKKITIEMVVDVFQKHNDKIETLSEEQVDFLNILYKALSQGTPITKNIIPNNTVYKVEKVNNTNDLYTGAVKITLDVNAPKYGRKEALSKILRDLDISNIIYLDGPIGPDFFNTIRWMKQSGLNESSNYRRVYIGNNDSLVESAKSNGLVYNDETGEVYIPSFIVGLTQQELETIKQNDILLNSDLFTSSELRNLSKSAVFKVSEYITMLATQENANEILLGDDFKNYNFVGKDRIDIIEIVGLSRLFNIVKERFFNVEDERTKNWAFETLDKAEIIYNNFDAFIDLGYDALIGMEGVSKYAQTDVSTNLDTIIDDKTAQEIQEIYGNSVEHWQVGFRQVSAFSSLSQLIKRTFEKMYVLDESGNQVINEFGFAATLSPQECVSKVLKWTQYSNTIQEMIDKIKYHQSTNPWVSQLLEKLESNDETFKSQFFSNFKKYFQKYSIVYREEASDKVLMKMINESSYADTIEDEIKGKLASYAMGNYTLKNTNGTTNIESLEKLKSLYAKLLEKTTKDPESMRILESIYKILDIPLPNSLEFLNNVSQDQFNTAKDKLKYLINSFETNKDKVDFNPLKGGEYKYLIRLSANILGENLEAVSYEAGKLYYSYVTPSYLNKLIGKLQGHVENYDDFIYEEYGKYPQFFKKNKYRSYWLQQLVSDENVRKHLDHKASLHYLGTSYTEKSPDQYIASIMQEYFYDDKNKAWAWYRIPMMSNKPSEEYIKFIRISTGYETAITNHLIDILTLEIDRMAAVKQRETLNKDLKVENFDTGKGARFVFLDYLNEELDTNSELGQLIKRKVNQESLNPTEEVHFLELATKAIKEGMEKQYQKEKEYWIKEGFLKETSEGMSVKGINLGDTKEQIENSLREFFWNDTFASINILQLTITDIAYYENAEDLQKRLAQLHAPGMRGNLQAKDINGQLYTDGFHRSFILEDFKIESEIIPNLIIVREQLLDKENDPIKKALIRSQFEDILKEFKKVNVADAQAYSSPTSYRKKMGIFGKWSIEQENAYNEIKKGNVNIGNLSILWQPLKPFVYSQAEQQGYSTVFDKLKVGYQFKNSEYLLIMADALLRAGNRPNKLSAIFDIMEESADKYPSKGIDTVQFKSAVKTGLSGVLNINNMNSEEEIKTYLRSKIYKDGFYSLDYVKTLPMEDFSLQQEVPGHFKGMQQSGSQNRILTVADFPTIDKDGKDILIKIDGETITVKEAKNRYYKAIADNINDSYQELIRRFKLDNTNTKMQNIAISRVLQDAILKDARLGSDLLWACSVNKHGEFNIPLSDPTQSDRIQQLLNSIIKNNINKQEIAGGPVVQVSNYGTADELHIRYQDENGNILMTEEEFNMQNPSKEFVSKEGYKTFEEYLKANQKSVAYFECYVPIYDDFIVQDFGRSDGTIDIEAMEKTNPDLLRMIGYRIPTEAKYSMVPIKIKGFLPPNAGEGIMLPKEITTLSGSDFDIDKLYIMRYMFNREESFDRSSFIDHLTSNNPRADKNKINDILNRNLAGEEFEEGSLEMGIFDYYVKYKKAFTTVKYTRPTSGKHANNNTTISIQYAVLTHENSLEQLFTPGNFNVPKKLGYLIDILKNMPNKELKAKDIDVLANYRELSKEGIYTLKDQSTKYKNLIYSSVHVQFHKQNMVAGKLIGVFATGNVSHAFMSLRECFANITEGTEFVINGKLIAGETRIDPEFDESGYRVSSNLASFLAASVDAVKDPILNLLNINVHTANILMTLLRLGFDTETACLLLSQPIVTKVINTLVLSEETSYIGDIINNMKKSLEDNLKIEVPSNFNFTKEFFIENLLESNEQNDLYVLNLLEKLLSLSDLFKDVTHMTKYNSITSAVGPFASDTEYKRLQMMAFKSNDMVTESIKETVNNPILKAFRDDAYSLEQSLLGNNIIQASPAFKTALRQLQSTLGYLSDKLSSKFSDFFIDYIVNMGEGVFDMSLEHRKEVIFDYPNQILKEKDNYPENLLLQNIKYVTDNSGFPTLELRTRGLSEEQSQDITAHWAKLYKDNPELAIKIFEYNVIRGTFGFNPKTFTKLVPNILKQSLPRYVEKLSISNNFTLAESEIENIINQFILNNGLNPAGTHNMNNFEKINEISENEFYIKPKKKDKTVKRFGIGNIIIDNVSYTAYFEKSSYHDTIKVSLVDSLGGNGKAIELNPNERFPKSIFKQDNTTNKQDNSEKRTSPELSVKDVQGILLSKLYNTDELQRISQYNLSDSNIRSKFFLSMQERYSKVIGRSLTFAERSFFWNNTESMQDIINLLASSNSSDYIKIIGDINTTLEDLKLCSN